MIARVLLSSWLSVAALSVLAQAPDTAHAWLRDRLRRIHMDFHTLELDGEPGRDVIRRFDAGAYVRTLRGAHVNSLVSFAKDHHGNAYYATALGHRHGGLPDTLDMLGEILREGHAHDLRVLAYFSVGWLTPVERARPGWMERNAAGEVIGTGNRPKADTWNNICLNSPYLEEVVLPELGELCGAYDLDGLWLDIIENNPCYCGYCTREYAAAHDGAAYPDHAAAVEFAAATRYRAVARMVQVSKAAFAETHPGAAPLTVSYNTAGRDAGAFPLVDFASVETHPGATWHQGAWTHALLTMKYLERLGKPWESTTSRFVHGWGGWDDQPEANMLAVASRIAAHAGVINLGDQTYPDGTLDAALYERIGRVFAEVEAREAYCTRTRSAANVALFAAPFDIYAIYGEDPGQLDRYLGAAKALADGHHAFDLVAETDLGVDLARYDCLVLPEVGPLQPATADRLLAYVAAGGKLLATGDSSLDTAAGHFGLAEAMGVDFAGYSPYSHGYLDVGADVARTARRPERALRRSPLLVPGRLTELRPLAGGPTADTLAAHVYPLIEPRPRELFFFRNGRFSPPGRRSGSPAITRHRYGEGEVVYAAAPLFTDYWREGQWYLKDVALNLLDGPLDVRPPVRLEGPQSLELFAREKDGTTIAHVINYQPHRETNQVEEVVPVGEVVLRFPGAAHRAGDVRVVDGTRAGAAGGFRVTREGETLAVALERVGAWTVVAVGPGD